MSEQVMSQYNNHFNIDDHYNSQENNDDEQNQKQKHSNEFLSESYEESDKKNQQNNNTDNNFQGNSFVAADNNYNYEIQQQQQQSEQERHINELIDNYNSQYEFYKPNKSTLSGQHEINNNKQNQYSSNQQSQQQYQQLQNNNNINNNNNGLSYQDKPIPITAVLAEERAKNQYIQQSSAANVQSFQNDDYEYCPNCNRKFFSGRLNLHLKSCKPNKPLKPVKKASQSQPDIQEQQEDHNSQQQQQLSPTKYNMNQPSSFPKNDNNNKNVLSSSQLVKEKQQKGQHQQQYQQNSKISNQSSTQDNSERDDISSQQQASRYNIEQFEHKISEQQIDSQNDNRVECEICGRKFMADRIAKHEVACSKSQKARPVYNSSLARCPQDENGQILVPKNNLKPPKQAKKQSELTIVPKAATEVIVQKKKEDDSTNENSIQLSNTQSISTNNNNKTAAKPPTKNNNASKNNNQDEKPKKIPKWKLEHQQFIENIRYNKQIKQVEKEGGDISKIEKPQDDLEALGYINCQYCHRKFAKETAERHIPLCKNIINRPKPPRQPSRQNSEKITGSTQQNSENKKQGIRKVVTKNNFSIDDNEGQQKSSISTNMDSQQRSEMSDQMSLLSNKTLNTTNGGGYKVNAKVSSAVYDKQSIENNNNQKSRTGLLPDINGKQQQVDKKYFTSRKFGSYNSRSNGNNVNNVNNMNNSNSGMQNQKAYEDVYTRVQQISTVACPHCERVFAKNAADRHIPICKNIVNRPNPLSDITRSTRQSVPKKVSGQQILYTQRQSLGHNQQSPKQQNQSESNNRIVIDGQNFIKPRTSDSTQISQKISLNNTKTSNFCGFCGFQFAMDHKYCGSCGKQRFSIVKKPTSQSINSFGSKNNFDQSSAVNNNNNINNKTQTVD